MCCGVVPILFLLGFSFEVRAQTEMKKWCIKGMCMLKVVSNEEN